MSFLSRLITLSVASRRIADEFSCSHHIPYSEFKEREKQHEGWTSGGEDTDGGDAIKPASSEPGMGVGNGNTGSQGWW